MNRHRVLRALFVLGAAATIGACVPRPTAYTPPPPVAPPAYKENADWKTTEPQDALVRDKWWEIFGDPQLNALEERVSVSNQTLKAVEAQFVQALALVRATRSGLSPQVTAAPSISVQQPSGNRAISSFHDEFSDFFVPASVSYEADVWGRVRSSIRAAGAAAQATAADLESVRLSLHGELAVDYFTLRSLDRDRQLLDAAVDAYERALQLTQNRYQGGIASLADVAQAETQLETTRAQAVDVDAQRAAFEHAIAVLVGESASTFAVPVAPLDALPPDVPVGIPSALLERRPDIAAAERRIAAATAQLGVVTAAFYPTILLTGGGGFESRSLTTLLTGVSNFWSLGAAALTTLVDGGRRQAAADQARGAIEQSAAAYQATVLSAFREVEDQLSTLRILENESTVQDRAVAASDRALTQANNRYAGGVATYLEVIVAQTAALNNQRTAARIVARRMAASVLLLRGIGGGWTRADLPVVPVQ